MAFRIDPLTGELVEDNAMPQMQQAAPAPSPISNPIVQDYIAKKFNLGQYSDENRQKLMENAQPDLTDKIGAALAAAGAGFMGRDPAQAGMAKLAAAKQEKRQALEDFEKGRSNKIQEMGLERQATIQGREDEAYKEQQTKLLREKDPTSAESVMAQDLARKMGYKGDVSTITAEKFKQFSPALEKMYALEENRKDKNLDRALKQQELDLKKSQMGSKTSEGQKAVDKDFAKDYNDWTSAGRASLQKNLESLKEARDALRKDSSLSGGLTGILPDQLTADRVLKQRQKVQSAVQNSLKATLGSQFTEKEGERILKNAYNEAASPETNVESLNALITQLETQGRNNDAKAKHFEQKGSLQGFTAPGAQRGPKPGDVEDGHRFKGGNPADPNNWEQI